MQLLATVGFEVLEATNGTEEIKIWENFKPHLILMAMKMPELDGYQAVQRIKAAAGQTTIAIAISASAFELEKLLMLSSGCDDIICKPVEEQVIFDKIAQYLGASFIEASTNISTKDSNYSLNLSAMQALPRSWLTELEQATLTQDRIALEQLICRIQPQETALAEALKKTIENLEYAKILAAIDAVKGDNKSSTAQKNNSAIGDIAPQRNRDREPTASVCSQWIAKIKQAIYIADLNLIEELINQIKREHPVLAEIIQGHLDEFDYQKNLAEIAEIEPSSETLNRK